RRLDPQSRARQFNRDSGAARHAETGKSFHHQWKRVLIEPSRIGQQEAACFADETNALRNARKQWDQGRLKGIRQYVGAIVVPRAQGTADLQALAQREFAMGEWTFDRVR